ncbi:hypothetical protein H7U08_19295 [Bacillus cereus]|uniref:Uncharacterized protein n=1 Tax=Bacillus cereus TaxID=1396 RepID=A0AAW4QZ13_BACCE|nr:hypothetical protein [Bacillus cereus]MBY0038660.1 hypothetical protein [Bacillus cereus]
MFEKYLLDFFKNGLSNWALLRSYQRNFVIFGIVQSTIFLTISIYLVINSRVGILNIFIATYAVQVLVSFAIFIKFFVKRYIFKVFKMELNSDEWYIFKLLLLKKFLFHTKIISKPNKNKKKNEEALDFCIERLEKIIEKEKGNKFSTLFKTYTPILIAFSVPLWTAFNNWMYQKSEFALGQATAYLFSVFLFLFITLIFWIILYHYLIEDMLGWGEQRISHFMEMLHKIKFSLNNSYYLDEFEGEYINELINQIIKEYNLKKIYL